MFVGPRGGRWSYLGSEVESEVAVVCQGVLDHERHISRQAQLNSARKAAGLAEVDQVLEGESEGDGLTELNVDVHFVFLDIGVLAQSDGSRADVAGAAELDTLLCALDVDCSSGLDLVKQVIVMGIAYQTLREQTDLCKCAEARQRAE